MILIISCLAHGLSQENCLHQFFSFMYMTVYLKPYLLKCKLVLSFRYVYHFHLFYVVTEILIFLSYFYAIKGLLF